MTQKPNNLSEVISNVREVLEGMDPADVLKALMGEIKENKEDQEKCDKKIANNIKTLKSIFKGLEITSKEMQIAIFEFLADLSEDHPSVAGFKLQGKERKFVLTFKELEEDDA